MAKSLTRKVKEVQSPLDAKDVKDKAKDKHKNYKGEPVEKADIFHGTTLENARAIKRAGSKLMPSTFGEYGPGVYASETADDAALWAAKKGSGSKKRKVAVISDKQRRERFVGPKDLHPLHAQGQPKTFISWYHQTPAWKDMANIAGKEVDKAPVPIKRFQTENPTSARRRAKNRLKRPGWANGDPGLPPETPKPNRFLGMQSEKRRTIQKSNRFSKSLWRGMSVENASRVQRARGFAGHPGSQGGDIGRGIYFARTKRDAMDYAKPLKNGRGTPKSSRRIGRVAEVEEGKVRPLWEGGASPKWTHRASHTDGRPGRGTGLSTYPQVTIDPKDAKKLKLKRIENVNATTVERTMSRGLHPSGKTRYQVHREQQAAQYGGTKEERRARLASKKKKSSGTIYPNSFGKSLEQSPSAFGVIHKREYKRDKGGRFAHQESRSEAMKMLPKDVELSAVPSSGQRWFDDNEDTPDIPEQSPTPMPDEVAARGKVRVLLDNRYSASGLGFAYKDMEDPTWADIAVMVDKHLKKTKDPDHRYIEGLHTPEEFYGKAEEKKLKDGSVVRVRNGHPFENRQGVNYVVSLGS
jgi:hypothetical protein